MSTATSLPSYWERPVLHEPTLTDLVSKGYISTETATLLSEVVKRSGRVAIYGNADTGKTALADALTSHVPLGTVLERHSRTKRSLLRQGLSPLPAPPHARGPVFVRADDDVPVVQRSLTSDSGLIASFRSGSLPALCELLGTDRTVPFDVVVEMRKHRDDSTGTTLRYVSAVLISEGGTLTEIESGFVNPWGEVLWRRLETAQARSRRLLDRTSAPAQLPPVLTLGVDYAGLPVTLGSAELKGRMALFGATGFGRSAAVRTVAESLFRTGWDGVVVDPHGSASDGAMHSWVTASQPRASSGQWAILGAEGSARVDLLEGLSIETARDLLFSALQVEDSYQSAIARRFLGELLTLLSAAHLADPVSFPAPSLQLVVRISSAPSIQVAVKKMAAVVLLGKYTRADFATLLTPSKADMAAAQHVAAALSPVVHQLSSITGPGLDLSAPGSVYVGLDVFGRPDLSRLFGAALLRRLAAEVRSRSSVGGSRPLFVLVEHPELLDASALLELSSAVSAAGMLLLLSSTSPLVWESASPPPGVTSLLEDVNVLVTFGQGDMASAERVSDLLGSPGEGKQLRALGTGEFVLRVASPVPRTAAGMLEREQ